MDQDITYPLFEATESVALEVHQEDKGYKFWRITEHKIILSNACGKVTVIGDSIWAPGRGGVLLGQLGALNNGDLPTRISYVEEYLKRLPSRRGNILIWPPHGRIQSIPSRRL